MKKVIALLLAVVLAASICGCQTPAGPDLPSEDQLNEVTAETLGISLTYPEVDLSDYTTYYFDSENGFDSNAGTSESAPKKTLEEAARLAATATAENPVRILLKKGAYFKGNWHLSGYESTKEKPLIIDAYGEGEGYPVVDGYGSDVYTEDNCATILVQDDNIRILNLEITGITAYQGIYVFPRSGGAFENVVIEGCYVHDINFNWTYDTAPKDTSPDDIDPETVCPATRYPQGDQFGRYVYRKYSAICFYNGTLVKPSWFENTWILNNIVMDVGKIGINVYNMWDNQPGFGYGYNKYMGEGVENVEGTKMGRFPNKYVVCKGNYVERSGSDGIVLSGCDYSTLEWNVVYYANYLGRAGYWNGGAWIFGSHYVLYQYNEVAYTYRRHGVQDAEGLDIDNSCSNVYCRYNYAHHNEGGGLLLCNKETTMSYYDSDGNLLETKTENGIWKDNYIYGNVMAYNGNDFEPTRSGFITIARAVGNGTYIFNNTAIMNPDIPGQSIINTEDKNTACKELYFYNNIFYAPESTDAKFTIVMMHDYLFENNLFYNVTTRGIDEKSNVKAITDVDPQFTMGSNIDGFNALSAFRPANEAVYTMGMELPDLPYIRWDITLKKVDGKSYLGAIYKE